MFGQNSHNSDLSTHILNVDLRSQLTLGNSLAGEGLASFDLKALVRDPKFTPAKLLPKAIFLENVVPCRVIGENGSGMTNRGLADRFDKGMIGGRGLTSLLLLEKDPALACTETQLPMGGEGVVKGGGLGHGRPMGGRGREMEKKCS